jgi:uncharacterized membrane protein YidH (DUF202 family)
VTVPAAPGAGGEARDPGLQPERTSLAWRRTLLALLVLDVLVLRAWLLALARAEQGAPAHSVGLGVCVAVAALSTAVLAWCGHVRARELRHGTTAPPAAVLRWATAAALVLGAATIAVVLIER